MSVSHLFLCVKLSPSCLATHMCSFGACILVLKHHCYNGAVYKKNSAVTVVGSSSKTSNRCMCIRTSNTCIKVQSNILTRIPSNIYKTNTNISPPPWACPLGKHKNHVFILFIVDVILMHILAGILMHILDVLIRMHISDVMLLLQGTAGGSGPGLPHTHTHAHTEQKLSTWCF